MSCCSVSGKHGPPKEYHDNVLILSFLVAQARVLLPNKGRPSRGVMLVLMKRMLPRRMPLLMHPCHLPLLQAQEVVDVDVALGELLRTMLAEAPLAALVVEAVLPVPGEQLGTRRSPAMCTVTMVRTSISTSFCWQILLTVTR